MNGFARFMKQNKLPRETAEYPASASLTDADGKPLLWRIRPLTTRECEALRAECERALPDGTRTMGQDFLPKLCAAAVEYPDLQNAALQDSYGVCTPHDLLFALLDAPGEYDALVGFVRRHSGLDVTTAQLTEQAKN